MLHKRHSNVTKDASDGLHASCRSKVIYVTKDAGSEDRPPGLGKGIERERERERERASRWRARKQERASRWRATELRGVTAVIASTLRRCKAVCGDLVLVHSLPRAIGISLGGVCLLDIGGPTLKLCIINMSL